MTSVNAELMLIAIGLQESGLRARQQYNDGPATGLFQFEIPGVQEVMEDFHATDYVKAACESAGVPFDAVAIHEALKSNDILAAQLARLLLWINKDALPSIGDVQSAWNYYLNTWYPGKPSFSRWKTMAYPTALALFS